MSSSLESDRKLTLAEAAERLGCHVETLRIRVRQGRLEVSRGPHGRYYVSDHELALLMPPRRMKRRAGDASQLEVVAAGIDRKLALKGWLRWEREMVEAVRSDPAADSHLYRVLAVEALLLAGFNQPETAQLLGVSVRHVRRLRKETWLGAVLKGRERSERAERGRLRRVAKPIVVDIQKRLQAAGFRPARRDPRSWESGARGGVTARIALVKGLNRDQVQDLRIAGLSDRQIAAISLVGIGADEFHELVLNGLP